MNQGSNVVKLEAKRVQPVNSRAVKLPAPLLKLRERCGTHLKKLMERLFEKIDDTFFDLADQAASNTEQTAYFDAMRDIRLKKNAITRTFLECYQKDFEFDFDELADSGADVFDSDNLSIVQHDELEEQVAIDNIVNRIKNEVGQDLEHLTLRFDALLPTVSLTEERNPVGAYCLASNFGKACEDLDIEIRSKLVLYKIFEKQVLSQVKSMLAAANKFLVEQGVMPDLSTAKKAMPPRHHTPPPASSPAQSAVIDGGTGMVMNLEGGLLDDVPGGIQIDPMALIAQAQTQLPDFNQGYTQSNLPVLRQPSLVNALSTAQQKENAVPVNDEGLVNFVNLLRRMLRGKDGNPRAKIGQIDQDAINLVSMLFEFILEDRQLQAPIKALLGRLQIPLVKVALVDKTFFNKGGHVARRLLNEMAMASIGWTEKEKGAPDPFLSKLEELVLRIVNEFEDDVSLFHEVLEDFLIFQEGEKKRRILVEQRTRDSEEGRAKSDAAKRYVQNELNGLLFGHSIADSVLEILRDGWSSYMVLLSLKHGDEHESLVEAKQTASELIRAASLESDHEPLSPEGLDNLVESLKNGLSQTAFKPFELDKVIEDLTGHLVANAQRRLAQEIILEDDFQTDTASSTDFEEVGVTKEVTGEVEKESSLLSGPLEQELEELANTIEPEAEPATSMTAESVEQPSVFVETDLLAEDEQEIIPAEDVAVATEAKEQEAQPETTAEKADQTLPVESGVGRELADIEVVENPAIVLLEEEPEIAVDEVDSQVVARVEKLGIGSWVEMREGEEKFYRCKLAAIIKSTGKYIFVNRMGVKVAEKTRAGLIQDVSDKMVNILDDGLLFDRALENVISTLRK